MSRNIPPAVTMRYPNYFSLPPCRARYCIRPYWARESEFKDNYVACLKDALVNKKGLTMREGHAIDNENRKKTKCFIGSLAGISLTLYSRGQAESEKVDDGEMRPFAYEIEG